MKNFSNTLGLNDIEQHLSKIMSSIINCLKIGGVG